MKRMYIGIVLLVVMLMAGILLTILFRRIHSPLSAGLEQAKVAALAGNWHEVSQLTAAAHQQWTRYRNFTAAFADHEPLEEMDALFARLEILCKMQQSDEYASDCAELSRLAMAMADSQRITWWNLL